MKIVWIVILIDLLIFTIGSLYVRETPERKSNFDYTDRFGYEWKYETHNKH